MKKAILIGLLLCGFLMGPIFPGPLAPALATVTDTYTPVQLTGDGSDKTFDFDFKIFNNTDLVVAIVDPDTLVATTQTLGTDYSVSINTSTAGGTVTFVAAPDDGDYVSIRRSIPVTQSTDIPSGGLFREQQIENALDKQTLVSQQLKEFQDRSIAQNPYATAISDLTLPLPSAGKPIKWNDDADGLENGDTAIDDIVTAAAASAASASSSASTATTQAGLATTARIAAQTYAAALKSTSTSSLAIGIGSKTFVTQAGKQFSAGQYVIAVSDANSANYMHGQVTNYSGTSLVVEVTNVGGSGTLADWTISVSGSRGPAGSGATTALDNLASVAINTSLISDTDNTDDLGSSSKAWKDAYIKGNIGVSGAAIVNGVTATTQSAGDNSTKVATTAYAENLFFIGSTTRNLTTESGTQVITGVGFTPKIIDFIYADDVTIKSGQGWDNGTSHKALVWAHGLTANTFAVDPSYSIVVYVDGSNYYKGQVTTLGSDGFTITWEKTGSPTGTLNIVYKCSR